MVAGGPQRIASGRRRAGRSASRGSSECAVWAMHACKQGVLAYVWCGRCMHASWESSVCEVLGGIIMWAL